MGTIWIVHLTVDDGTDLDGRLEVAAGRLRFTPGTHGVSVPALEIPISDIVATDVDVNGMRHRVVITVADGRRIVIDHGVRPVDELAAHLRPPSATTNHGTVPTVRPTDERTTS